MTLISFERICRRCGIANCGGGIFDHGTKGLEIQLKKFRQALFDSPAIKGLANIIPTGQRTEQAAIAIVQFKAAHLQTEILSEEMVALNKALVEVYIFQIVN